MSHASLGASGRGKERAWVTNRTNDVSDSHGSPTRRSPFRLASSHAVAR